MTPKNSEQELGSEEIPLEPEAVQDDSEPPVIVPDPTQPH